VSAELVEACHASNYVFDYDGKETTMRIGEFCPEAGKLLEFHNVEAAFFITAWNPFSVSRPGGLNGVENRILELELTRVCVAIYPAEASDNGDWTEPGFLAVGVVRSNHLL